MLAGPASEVAPRLLNKVLIAGGVSARIVEVEAYEGPTDEASHGHRGLTPRTEVMFGPPGHLYVYFIYGMHWCANVVTDADGTSGAVLIRAAEIIDGVEHARQRRGERITRPVDLTNGPAKLCAALGIDGTVSGVDVCSAGSAVRLVDDGAVPSASPVVTTRVGITKATELRWRWCVPDNPWVSKGRPA